MMSSVVLKMLGSVTTSPIRYSYAMIGLYKKEEGIKLNKKVLICLAILLVVASTALAYPGGSGQTSLPVTIFAGEGGHLDPEGSAFVARGTVLEIAIIPDDGYHCIMFTVNGKSFLPQPSITVTVNQSTTVSVFFEKD